MIKFHAAEMARFGRRTIPPDNTLNKTSILKMPEALSNVKLNGSTIFFEKHYYNDLIWPYICFLLMIYKLRNPVKLSIK